MVSQNTSPKFLKKQLNLRGVAFVALLSATLCVSSMCVASAEASTGLKTGDWIEYNIGYGSETSDSSVPVWLRIEVLGVQGTNVTFKAMRRTVSASLSNLTMTFDVRKVPAELMIYVVYLFFVPANLNKGDTFNFYNGIYILGGYSNQTITDVGEKTYGNMKRTVVSASVPNPPATAPTTFYWDRATGILLEANAYYPSSQKLYEAILVKDTNIWQTNSGPSPLLYVLSVGAGMGAVAAAILILKRRRARGGLAGRAG